MNQFYDVLLLTSQQGGMSWGRIMIEDERRQVTSVFKFIEDLNGAGSVLQFPGFIWDVFDPYPSMR